MIWYLVKNSVILTLVILNKYKTYEDDDLQANGGAMRRSNVGS